ncbi:MAG: hypothetical protein J6B13_08075 [Muribaculaceae bacterium]|nr:hypothetical protein [Muribaculaceae bacterium]
MWLFFKHLIQLLLSPSRGWEDISEAGRSVDDIRRTGYYPLIGITALSEFLRLLYGNSPSVVDLLLSAIAVAGTMFASMYLGRLLLDMTLPKCTDGHFNPTKVDCFTTYLLGIDCLFLIFANAMPAHMTFVNFLPLLSLIIIFKATQYLDIREDSRLNFTILAIIAVIVIPIALGSLLLLFI